MEEKNEKTIFPTQSEADGALQEFNLSKSKNLTERLEDFYKKPINEIQVESTQEIDTGNPVGDEIW